MSLHRSLCSNPGDRGRAGQVITTSLALILRCLAAGKPAHRTDLHFLRAIALFSKRARNLTLNFMVAKRHGVFRASADNRAIESMRNHIHSKNRSASPQN